MVPIPSIDSCGLTRRSSCPVNYMVELLGDRWSLIIIRDMLFNGKRTFGEFLASSEGIARNILAARLRQLEQDGLMVKQPFPGDGRKDVYSLSEKGKQLLPILRAMAEWSFANEPMTRAYWPGEDEPMATSE